MAPLENYKNHCWKVKLSGEMVDHLYQNNMYDKGRCSSSLYDNCADDFTKMREQMTLRIENEALYLGHGFNETVTWRLRCLPHVFLGGVTKSGTTDLYYRLIQHKDIVAPSMKEPMYFNRNRLGLYELTYSFT